MFDDDDYNPVEPFSQDEFVVHNERELRTLMPVDTSTMLGTTRITMTWFVLVAEVQYDLPSMT